MNINFPDITDINPRTHVVGFIEFIRQQGVVGFAIGFILGGAVSSVVNSFVNDIVNPLIGYFFTQRDLLSQWMLGPVKMGSFITVAINFVILAAVVYFVFKGLKLDRIDLPKDQK